MHFSCIFKHYAFWKSLQSSAKSFSNSGNFGRLSDFAFFSEFFHQLSRFGTVIINFILWFSLGLFLFVCLVFSSSSNFVLRNFLAINLPREFIASYEDFVTFSAIFLWKLLIETPFSKSEISF